MNQFKKEVEEKADPAKAAAEKAADDKAATEKAVAAVKAATAAKPAASAADGKAAAPAVTVTGTTKTTDVGPISIKTDTDAVVNPKSVDNEKVKFDVTVKA